MKYLHLIWAALFRRKTRTVFTIASVMAAFLLFGLLDSVRTAFGDAGNSVAGVDRLLVMSKISMTVSLPQSLLPRIEAVPGVKEVAYGNWFGGIYQDPKNFFPNEAVSDNFLDVFDEYEMPEDQRAAFRNTRTGAIVGAELAERFGWKIGDKIPLQATIFPQRDGSNTWTFDLVGIFHARDRKEKNRESIMFFRWKYLDEARPFDRGRIGFYVAQLADVSQADQVAHAIDAISANSDHETKTQSENAFNRAFVSQFADIGLIVGGIMIARPGVRIDRAIEMGMEKGSMDLAQYAALPLVVALAVAFALSLAMRETYPTAPKRG